MDVNAELFAIILNKHYTYDEMTMVYVHDVFGVINICTSSPYSCTIFIFYVTIILQLAIFCLKYCTIITIVVNNAVYSYATCPCFSFINH